MDIYDDLERFNHKIGQNINFLHFEETPHQELSGSVHAIFRQLSSHFDSGECHKDHAPEPEIDMNTTSSAFMSNMSELKPIDSSGSAIFDSVAKISSQQSLEHIRNKTIVETNLILPLAPTGTD